ncbi:MAG: N-acetyltransferase [Acidimicrobiia bacterium]|nr:N-acetyltransferase [Acidimicrobiia bacterium]
MIHPSAIIEEGASIGEDVVVGPFSIIHGNVTLGDGSVVDSHCVLGHTEPGLAPAPLIVGPDARIRSHSLLYGGSEIGSGLQTGHRVTIREGSSIGESLRVGTLSDLQGSCSIGNYVRFHSNVHISQASTVGDYVWIFPYVVLTNDPHPPSDGFLTGVTVEEFAVIATMSIILPGLTVGRDSLVGAHSMVNRDVRPGAVVAGTPAKDRGDASAIELRDGSGPAYPWRRHFHRGYPDDVVAQWKAEFGS